MINLKLVSKKFGSVEALKNVSLHIKRGEFYCLLGPNGAGKTTALKLITGLMRPTSGTITVNGYDNCKKYFEVKKILGFIPDAPFLYENLTPQEFLEFVGELFAVEKRIVQEKIDYYLEIFSLKNSRNVLIKELSHGMRQKIVYASCFIHDSLLYLIDEPLVGLDPYSIHLIKKLLKEEIRNGKTILMCTHILSIAEELADRIGILNNGQLIIEGKPQEIKEKFAVDSLETAFLMITRQ